jgi:hypothetical protein
MTDDSGSNFDTTANTRLAEEFLNAHRPDGWFRGQTPEGFYSIAEHEIGDLADAIQDLIANLVAMILDAGSERDAVLENDVLNDALIDELRGWSITEPQGETNK